MAKEVNKENLRKYAEEHLEGTINMVAAGMMKPERAKGHVRELFYLSATFDLGLQDKAREILKEYEK